eukprot:scaffold3719_cov247-Pinguiococcus_pyrenoidosus.AAC.4
MIKTLLRRGIFFLPVGRAASYAYLLLLPHAIHLQPFLHLAHGHLPQKPLSAVRGWIEYVDRPLEEVLGLELSDALFPLGLFHEDLFLSLAPPLLQLLLQSVAIVAPLFQDFLHRGLRRDFSNFTHFRDKKLVLHPRHVTLQGP